MKSWDEIKAAAKAERVNLERAGLGKRAIDKLMARFCRQIERENRPPNPKPEEGVAEISLDSRLW